MEIYLIRHTKPDIEKGICYGQSDIGLADSFKGEVDSLKAKADESFEKIYSSPLKRCMLLSKELGSSIDSDTRLMEMNFGEWEMKPWNQLPEDQLSGWMNDFVNVQVPNGESFFQLINRVEIFVKSLLEKEDEKVCVVTHAGVIRTILGYFLKMNPKDYFKLQIDYGGVSLVKINQGLPQVEFINR